MAMSTATPTSGGAFAKKIYRAVGFTKAYNFWLWLILSTFFLGFVLLRLSYLDFSGVFCGSVSGGKDHASPGECFYYLQPGRYQLGIILHLGCILPASILAATQFVPLFRRKAMRLHRINGWISVVLGIVSTVGSVAIARRAMGGGLDTQSMVGMLAIMFVVSLTMGCIKARNHKIEEHRAWMLRAWVYSGSIISMRIIMTAAMIILSSIGGYYSAQPCDKINFILQGENATMASYPDCAPFFSGEDPDRHIAVRANVFTDDKVQIAAIINMVFGMSGWVGIAFNTIGVELYVSLGLNPLVHERKCVASFFIN
ncbi:hypothetical protein F4819DRAFT_215766 [Hypoxylon fuscum]|nr:hypothetical protein F4819DRAFT_215766 [Hypoxylon fuscum]